jgi:hypothetical protein
MEKTQIPELRELLVRAKTERQKVEIAEMLVQHNARLLELGAAGRLLIAGAAGRRGGVGPGEADHA